MVAAETYVGEGLASGTGDLTTRIAKINLSVVVERRTFSRSHKR